MAYVDINEVSGVKVDPTGVSVMLKGHRYSVDVDFIESLLGWAGSVDCYVKLVARSYRPDKVLEVYHRDLDGHMERA